MTKEEKQLLLKDLCARLPYHPKINIYNDSWEGCQIGEFDNELWYHHIEAFNCDRIEIIPYLRPMSSMTKEEENEFISLNAIPSPCQLPNHTRMSWYSNATMLDWLYAHHFDYRGLIKKGLALEAPKDLYKEKYYET